MSDERDTGSIGARDDMTELADELAKMLAEHPTEVSVEAIRLLPSNVLEIVYRQPAGGDLRGLRVTADQVERDRETTAAMIAETAFLLVYAGVLEPKPDDEFGPSDADGVRWVLHDDWLESVEPIGSPDPGRLAPADRVSDEIALARPVGAPIRVTQWLMAPVVLLVLGAIETYLSVTDASGNSRVFSIVAATIFFAAGVALSVLGYLAYREPTPAAVARHRRSEIVSLSASSASSSRSGPTRSGSS